MGIFDFLLGRSRAYKLRKKYDRMRERADRIRDINERIDVLRLLDQLEPSVISLEEHQMSKFDKKRIASYIESNLRKIKFMLDESKKKESRKQEDNGFKDTKHMNR